MTAAGDRYAEAGVPEGCDFAAGEEHEVMKAWEDYLSGTAAEPKIRHVIARSWERCAAIGIDPARSGSKTIVEHLEFERRFQRNQTLLRASSDVLDEARQLLFGTGCMLVLTDLDGVILRTAGGPQTIDAGINGVGTSLAARGPVFVHGPEHFCSAAKLWTCAGSPVRNPVDGQLLGLIDVSGRKNTFQQHNLAFAKMVARRIETILKAEFETERRALMDYILAMRQGSWTDSVIVVGRVGKVLSANEQAPRLLALRSKGNAVRDTCLNPKNSLLQRDEDGKNFDLSAAAANFGIQSNEVLPVHHKGHLIGAVVIAPAARPKTASSGTLCLDEIGELPLDLQPFLIPLLEEGAVYRVADSTPRPIKVRLIAMTNRDLAKEVEQGHFRRDLLYRLKLATLQIPALRQRPGDAVLLAHYFVDALSKKDNLGRRRFAPEVLDLFKTYPWPGNIRVLRNAVESAFLLCDSPIIGCGWLPGAILEYRPGQAEPAPAVFPPAVFPPSWQTPGPGSRPAPPRAGMLKAISGTRIANILKIFLNAFNILLVWRLRRSGLPAVHTIAACMPMA